MILEDTQKELAIETLTEYINILNKEESHREKIKKVKILRDNLITKSNKEITKILNEYNKKIKQYNRNGYLED